VLVAPLGPAFLALPAMMFAFLMGFMSAAAEQNFSHARALLINEASAISRLINIPVQPPEYQVHSTDLFKTYLHTSLNDEWVGGHNEAKSQEWK
jgi:DNA-binding transcriptional regulator YdaS (Cro superfamily)